ncbi:hypothetical protein [Campylobacter sp. RM16188]|uniref:hypothetical protein n=1 Tax=Campylobacter sp. RM16188 TaxID=1705725 RepID=UPI0015556456|nr:hypothetical protein [Campylobacter sp. RM16188]
MLVVNGFNINLCGRCDFLTKEKACERYRHNIRESNQLKNIRYLRHEPKFNRYWVRTEPYGVMSLLSKNSKEFNHQIYSNEKHINEVVDYYFENIKTDYEKQTYTTKNGNVKKKSWRKDMTPFSEIVVSFGSERRKDAKEGLSQAEINVINNHDFTQEITRFINMYSAKYKVDCLLVAEHNDEKTKHFQIIFTNYDMEKHANLRFSGKKEMSKFGSSLQDLLAQAFSGIAIRGVNGTKSKHKTLQEMHQTEREYKQEKEFENSLKKKIKSLIGKFFTKEKPFFGEEFYRFEKKNVIPLMDTIFKAAKEEFADKIYLYSDTKLHAKVEQLTKELLDQDKIKTQNLAIMSENDELKTENQSLEQNLLEIRKTTKEQAITISNLIQKTTTQATQLQTLSAQNKEMKTILEQVKDSVELINELETERKDKEKINKNLADATKQIKNLQSEANDLKTCLSDTKNKLKIQNEINIKLNNKIIEQSDQITKMQNSLNSEKNTNLILATENQNLKIKNSLLETTKENLINFIKKVAQKFKISDLISAYLPELESEVKPSQSYELEF